ncbi:MAG: hypothetical protein QOH79_2888 [Acidimicrobiaceae bacterium]
MEHGRLVTIQDPTDEIAHQRAGEPATADRLVGAHRADLRVARYLHAHPGHGDENAGVVSHADVLTELDRAALERPRMGAADQRQHVVHIVGSEQTGGVGRCRLDGPREHLCRRDAEKLLPSVGHPWWLHEEDRSTARSHEVAEVAPRLVRRRVGDGGERCNVGLVPGGRRAKVRYLLLGTGEGMPHRVVEDVHGRILA